MGTHAVARDAAGGAGGAEDMNAEGQWQLTGSAAERYERVLAPAIFAPFAEDLVELAQLQDGERVLDVASGTGVVARHAAQKVRTTGRVTGLDLNQGMVEVARSLPPVPGAAPIIWIEGSALAMHLPDAVFDVVLCQQGVQFFPDRPAALREMRRVLVPGGRVLGTPSSGMSGPTRRQRSGRAGWARIPRCCGSSWHKQDSGMYRFVFGRARPVCQRSRSSCCGTLRPAQWPAQSMPSPTAPGKPSPRRSVRCCGHMVTERELRSLKRPMW